MMLRRRWSGLARRLVARSRGFSQLAAQDIVQRLHELSARHCNLFDHTLHTLPYNFPSPREEVKDKGSKFTRDADWVDRVATTTIHVNERICVVELNEIVNGIDFAMNSPEDQAPGTGQCGGGLDGGGCRTYLVVCPASAECMIVDPVLHHSPLYPEIVEGLTVRYIIDTHTHADHLSGLLDLRERLGGEAQALQHSTAPVPGLDGYLLDGQQLPLGALNVRVLHTPGHTPDELSLLVEGNDVVPALLSGDALLINGSGRCDFAGGNAEDSYHSVTKKLFSLDADTVVYPGHEYQQRHTSSIHVERTQNPRFLKQSVDEYVSLMDSLFDVNNLPLRINHVLQVNQCGWAGVRGLDPFVSKDFPSVRTRSFSNESAGDPEPVPFETVLELRTIPELSPDELQKMIETAAEDTVLLVDVRTVDEIHGEDQLFAQQSSAMPEQSQELESARGVVPGSVVVPLDTLVEWGSEQDQDVRDKVTVVCNCRSGVRSRIAAGILRKLGFADTRFLTGGMHSWNADNLPIDKV